MPSRPSFAAVRVQRPRHLAGPLPVVQVRQHLAPDEGPGRLAQQPPFRGVHDGSRLAPPPAGRRSGSAAAHRGPWPAGRTGWTRPPPAPSSPWMTKLTARRFGSSCRSTVSPAISGSSSRSRSAVSQPRSHPYAGVGRGPTRPGWRRRPCPPSAPRPAPRAPPVGSARPSAAARVRCRRAEGCRPGSRTVVAAAIGTRSPVGRTATWATASCGTSSAVKTPYGVASPGRVVSVQPGYEASASSTAAARRPARPAPCRRPAGVRAAVALASSVSASGWSVRARANSSPSGTDRLGQLGADQAGLGLDVESTEDEGHRVAEAAELVDADLERGRRRACPRTPLTRTRSGPSAAG